MPLLGEGGFGCVFAPPIKCSSKKHSNLDYNNKVSKYMKTHDAKQEMTEYNNIGRIDKNNMFHLGTPVMCAPSKASIASEKEMRDCKKYDSNTVKSHSILITPNGGIDLDRFLLAKNLNNYLNGGESFEAQTALFWTNAVMLIHGVSHFRTNNLMHLDIKPGNIVFDADTHSFKFIDFGLSTQISQYVDYAKLDLIVNKFVWSVPLEHRFISKHEFKTFKPDKMQSYVQNAMHSKYVPELFRWRAKLAKKDGVFIIDDGTGTASGKEAEIVKHLSSLDFYRDNYNKFVTDLVRSIDTYCLGYTLNRTLNVFFKAGALTQTCYNCFSKLFKAMTASYLPHRLVDTDDIFREYMECLNKCGFISHAEKNRHRRPTHTREQQPSNHVAIKSKTSADMDRITATLLKNVPSNSMQRRAVAAPKSNPKTHKHHAATERKPPCKSNKERSSFTHRCVKRCTEHQERSVKTRRCIKKCKAHTYRVESGRCAKRK